MFYQKQLFAELEVVAPYNFEIGDSFNIKGNWRRTVVAQIIVYDMSTVYVPKNVLFVPMLSFTFLSVSVMARVGLEAIFENRL